MGRTKASKSASISSELSEISGFTDNFASVLKTYTMITFATRNHAAEIRQADYKQLVGRNRTEHRDSGRSDRAESR